MLNQERYLRDLRNASPTTGWQAADPEFEWHPKAYEGIIARLMGDLVGVCKTLTEIEGKWGLEKRSVMSRRKVIGTPY